MTELPSSSAVTERTFAGRTAGAENGLRIRIEQTSIRIVKACDFYTGDLLTDKALDGGDFLHILTGHDGKRIAHALGPSRTPDAMDIVFRMMRHIEVDHMTDLFHVNAACGDVGRYHHLIATVAKAIQGALTFTLSPVGVKYRDRMTFLIEFTRDSVRSVLRAADNEDLVVIGAAKKLVEKLLLLANVHRGQRVRHRLGGRPALTDLDSFGVADCLITKLLDLRGSGGGEQQRLPCERASV